MQSHYVCEYTIGFIHTLSAPAVSPFSIFIIIVCRCAPQFISIVCGCTCGVTFAFVNKRENTTISSSSFYCAVASLKNKISRLH